MTSDHEPSRLAVNIGQHCFGYHYVVESADHRPVSLRGHCPLLVDLGILRRLPVRRMCRTILREHSLAHRRSRATVAGIARALHSAHTPLCKPVRYAHPERFIIDVNLDELHQCEGPMSWLNATEALQVLGVRPQTLYANVSRKKIRAKPDPKDTRRSLYHEADVRRMARQRGGQRKATAVAAAAIEWGDPILSSAISTVVDGRLYYRGQDAVVLSEAGSLEDVARLLWGGGRVNSADGGRDAGRPDGGDRHGDAEQSGNGDGLRGGGRQGGVDQRGGGDRQGGVDRHGSEIGGDDVDRRGSTVRAGRAAVLD